MGSGKSAYTLLQLMALSVLGRLVTPEEFGAVGAGLVALGLSTIVSSIGLEPAIVPAPQLEQRHLDTAFTASSVLGAGLGAIIWLGAPLAADFMHVEVITPVLRALPWVFPLHGLGTVAS